MPGKRNALPEVWGFYCCWFFFPFFWLLPYVSMSWGVFRVVVGTGCAVSNAFVDWSWCLQWEIHRKLGGFDGNFHPNKTFWCFTQKTCSVDMLFVKILHFCCCSCWPEEIFRLHGALSGSQILGAARGIKALCGPYKGAVETESFLPVFPPTLQFPLKQVYYCFRLLWFRAYINTKGWWKILSSLANGIMEWFGFEKTSKAISFQSIAMGRDTSH